MELTEAMLDVVMTLPMGRYLVVRPGSEILEVVTGSPSINSVYSAISTAERRCVCCDTITLRMGGNRSNSNPIVMMVDDTGMVDELPVNELATEIARKVKNYPHQIHGTAVICNDGDFA